MRDSYYRLVGRALRAWVGQRLHGLSGVRNVRGGVWVVLKLEWQPLHQRTPPTGFRKGCSSSPLASSSSYPPSYPLRQHGGFLLLVQPHHHLSLLLGFCSSFFQPHLLLSLLLGSGLSFGSGGGCLACCSFVFRML